VRLLAAILVPSPSAIAIAIPCASLEATLQGNVKDHAKNSENKFILQTATVIINIQQLSRRGNGHNKYIGPGIVAGVTVSGYA
jgi:hypothetical protein